MTMYSSKCYLKHIFLTTSWAFSVYSAFRGVNIAAGLIKTNMEKAQCVTDMIRLKMGKVSDY